MASILAGAGLLGSHALGEDSSNNPVSKPNISPFSTATHHEAPAGFDLGNLAFSRADKDYSESIIIVNECGDSGGCQARQASYSFSGYESGYATAGSEAVFFTSNADPDDERLSGVWNIWRGKGILDPWGFEPLPPPINSTSLECCMVSGAKNKFYFSSNRDGSWDIYEATWEESTFRTVTKLAHPNTNNSGEWPSYVDPEGHFMLFSSIRKTGMGGDDIYISYPDGDAWSEGILLPAPINSASYEDNAILSPSGRLFYWSSRRPTDFSEDIGNIYYLETDVPELKEFFQ